MLVGAPSVRSLLSKGRGKRTRDFPHPWGWFSLLKLEFLKCTQRIVSTHINPCSALYYTVWLPLEMHSLFNVKFVILWYNTLIENIKFLIIVYENFQYKVNLYVYTKNILCVYLDTLYGLLITDRCVRLLSYIIVNKIIILHCVCVYVCEWCVLMSQLHLRDVAVDWLQHSSTVALY